MTVLVKHTEACLSIRPSTDGLPPPMRFLSEHDKAAVLACPHPSHDTARLIWRGRAMNIGALIASCIVGVVMLGVGFASGLACGRRARPQIVWAHPDVLRASRVRLHVVTDELGQRRARAPFQIVEE